MWKKYIEIFKNSPCDIEGYFKYVYLNFKDLLHPLSKNSLLDEINKYNNDLFYQRKNIDVFFYEGCVSEAIACFEHYFEIDWSFLNFQSSNLNLTLDERYKHEFLSLQKSNFANNIYLDLERILQEDKDINRFMFLVLFFMPCVNKKDLLFNEKKARFLMCCNSISLESFYMLQELMKIYEQEMYNLFCNGYNFNHQLIEDCIENYQKLPAYQDNIVLEKILPLVKINILLNDNCTFTDFKIFRKNKVIYPDLHNTLMEIQCSLILKKLEKNLLTNSINDKKTIKI